ncbi:MAG TPA: FHA domain-containing protein [Planctomycetota bacterium]|nr:FHA domain-containing protein [Planctomycetota bacterium]
MLTVILKEGKAPQTLQLSQDVITFGRSKENVVIIRSIKASRHHAKIERIGGTYQITDLGSGNGTRVNGEKVDFQALKAGDEIKIGDAVLTLKSIDDAVDADAESSPSEQPTEEISLDAEAADELKIEGEEVKLEGEEVIEGEEVDLEEGKLEIADGSDLPDDERETEIAIKPPTVRPAAKAASPQPKPMAGKPAAAPGKPGPGKPAAAPEAEKAPPAKKSLMDRFKKKP